MTHHITRRAILAALPAAAASCTPVHAEVYAGETPLLRHLEAFREQASGIDAAPDYWAAHARLEGFARLARDMPVTSTADLAAKALILNGDGQWTWTLYNGPRRGPSQVLLDLRRLAV